ncbi:MAG: histidine--tRNA ligase [Clostridia bacterium]
MFSKTPPKGMRDFLPSELAFREQMLNTIVDTYSNFGFSRIETPCVEDLSILTSKQGGDNEKLIFKILKRGEKLDDAENGEICDLGLRYDLTVPLSRYIGANAGKLPTVFKAMQIGNVWRADRPQRGRFRQFIQSDIDILGEPSNLAEIELILATAETLRSLGLRGFTIRINDRKLLRALVKKCGFLESDYERTFIALDKLDKIGLDGVREEIASFAPDVVEKFLNIINLIISDNDGLSKCIQLLEDVLETEIIESFIQIMSVCKQLLTDCNVVFDVTLVRGMNYYTGSIYEISVEGFNGSVAGGGRYDDLIGKITGAPTCACGFSIGFERIYTILWEKGERATKTKVLSAVIVPKNISTEELMSVYNFAEQERLQGRRCSIEKRIKNFAFQLSVLREQNANIYGYKQGNIVKVEN